MCCCETPDGYDFIVGIISESWLSMYLNPWGGCLCILQWQKTFILRKSFSRAVVFSVLGGTSILSRQPYVLVEVFFWRVFFELGSSSRTSSNSLAQKASVFPKRLGFFINSNAFWERLSLSYFHCIQINSLKCLFSSLEDSLPWWQLVWSSALEAAIMGPWWCVARSDLLAGRWLAPSWATILSKCAVCTIDEALVLLWTFHSIRTMSRRFATQWNFRLTHGLHEM